MMMSSSNVSEETPHPTINVTDGSCSLSMFWRTEEASAHQTQVGGQKSTSLQVKSGNEMLKGKERLSFIRKNP